jgi:hypothetical protein
MVERRIPRCTRPVTNAPVRTRHTVRFGHICFSEVFQTTRDASRARLGSNVVEQTRVHTALARGASDLPALKLADRRTA